jgi:hypothetical protein
MQSHFKKVDFRSIVVKMLGNTQSISCAFASIERKSPLFESVALKTKF